MMCGRPGLELCGDGCGWEFWVIFVTILVFWSVVYYLMHKSHKAMLKRHYESKKRK